MHMSCDARGNSFWSGRATRPVVQPTVVVENINIAFVKLRPDEVLEFFFAYSCAASPTVSGGTSPTVSGGTLEIVLQLMRKR